MIRVQPSTVRRMTVTLAAAAFVVAATPACAQSVYHGHGRGQWNSRGAYDNGYREGWEHGENDARHGRDFAFAHTNDYRRADKGYHRRDGDIEWYRREFRRGYEIGYRDGYGRAGYTGRGGYDPYDRPGRVGGYGYPSGGGYPSGSYPGGGYGYPGGGYSGAGFQNGLGDGYEKGLEDARDGDRYDPERHRWYREGDRHYNSRYGPREVYKNEYRQGFREGYDRAFREAGRSGTRGNRRWWPF